MLFGRFSTTDPFANNPTLSRAVELETQRERGNGAMREVGRTATMCKGRVQDQDLLLDRAVDTV